MKIGLLVALSFMSAVVAGTSVYALIIGSYRDVVTEILSIGIGLGVIVFSIVRIVKEMRMYRKSSPSVRS